MTDDPRRTDVPGGSPGRAAYTVALVLAIGICTALNLLTIATVIDALWSAVPGISENATQILTGWGGGVVGVIGAVVGYNAGHANALRQQTAPPPVQAPWVPSSGSAGAPSQPGGGA